MTRRAWEQLELGRHISRATTQFIPGDTHILAVWVSISRARAMAVSHVGAGRTHGCAWLKLLGLKRLDLEHSRLYQNTNSMKVHW